MDERVFMVGPNASGKSNLLDVFRFLRDLAEPQGGFARAVENRGGVSQLRSLHARAYSSVQIDVQMNIDGDSWRYVVEFNQDKFRKPYVLREVVERDGASILRRPQEEDEADRTRLSQTHLEQVTTNRDFRPIAEFFSQLRYLHLVPQLVREPDRSVGRPRDPFGGDFLEQLARTPTKTLQSRLNRIRDALRIAVPTLQKLELERDDRGVPHLKGLYEHWRPNAGWQNEKQFSDGTLRLMGLLWVLLDGRAPLLLEEPELSLHAAVVRYIPQMMWRLNRKTGRQIVVSTHSADLLADEGISPVEVLLLQPTDRGTSVQLANNDAEIRALVESGLSMADAVLPKTAPQNLEQLTLFGG